MWTSCNLQRDVHEMAPTLYYYDQSSASRAALLTARTVLGDNVNLKVVDLSTKENLKPEFLKINPLHTVPVLTDGDVTIRDSHVISSYLVDKYASDDSLYPTDLKLRAQVDQLLYFDAATIFPKLKGICFPVLFHGKTTVDEDLKNGVHDNFSILEKFLEGKRWVTGDAITIADFSLIASISTLVELKFDLSKYPNVKAWFSRCEKEIPDYAELNGKGATRLGEVIHSLLHPNQI